VQGAHARGAVAAATRTARSLGLAVEETVVLHDSNRLTLRLLPCDVVARVAPVAQQVARFELDLARRLVEVGCPVAGPDPRVEPRLHELDEWVVTLWTYHASVSAAVSPADHGAALVRLHAGMRRVEVPTPHVLDRVEEAQRIVADRERSRALVEEDRELLRVTLADLGRRVGRGGRAEQLLHGEPHPGNVLPTDDGPLFVDLETCCRGPVEFDLAHAPEEVGGHYPGADPDLLRDCRLLVLAMNTAWRWAPGDRLPDGRRRAAEWLGRLRAAREAGGPGGRG